jgi:glycosyltransferase involved in cell wall biosynthesis
MTVRQLKVAFDARSLASPVLRGWDRYTVGLVGALAKKGVAVTLFHRQGEKLYEPHIAGLGCAVQAVQAQSGLVWEQVAVPLALARGGFDLFHAPAEHGVPLISACPVVLTIHSATAHSYYELIRLGLLPGAAADYLGTHVDPYGLSPSSLYWHAQVARADWVLTPSEFSRHEIVRFLGCSAERVSVTPLAVHEQFLRKRSADVVRQEVLRKLGVSRPYLLFVGGYERHKNVEGLLRVFALVHHRHPDLSLVLVGSAEPPAELVRRAHAPSLAAGRDVVFLSGLTEELTDLYDDAELFVTLSWRETFCLPALEAMARATPVVASSWGAAKEIVDGGGVLVDPCNEAAAADVISTLLVRPDRRAIGEQGQAAAQQYTWERTAAATLEIYERLCAGR